MKCTLCGNEIEEGVIYVKTNVNTFYHAFVQDCKNKKEDNNESTI